jgi:hypothetical protein
MDGVSYIYRNPNGNLYVRYLYWNDGAWNWNYNWLDNDWNDQNPAAMLATLFISLPLYCWESFVFEETWSVVQANHQAFFRPLQAVRIMQ